MSAAIQSNVPGIEGECGGCLDCATCHVYVAPEFVDSLPQPSELETELLCGVAAERRTNSRLGCQILGSAVLDRLVVHIPARQ
jgi:ferredoxin, 2Fe-2S